AVKVCCAVFATGSRNALTPLLTASTPVIAVQPLENAFSNSQTLTTACCDRSEGGAITGGGLPPAANDLNSPSAKVMHRVPTKRYVGNMKTAPVSPTPRRFTIVMTSKIVRHSDSVCGCMDGTADTSAPTPAEIPTAAVRR